MARQHEIGEDPLLYPSRSPVRPPDGRLAALAHATALADRADRRAWWRSGLRVRVRFLGQGHQWPLRPGDTLALSDVAHHPLGELPAELVLALVAHYVHAAELVGAVQRARAACTVEAPAPEIAAVGPYEAGRGFEDARTRAARRAARRRRKR